MLSIPINYYCIEKSYILYNMSFFTLFLTLNILLKTNTINAVITVMTFLTGLGTESIKYFVAQL